MDKERFDALCLQEQAADGGIGTLGEKRLHRVLKVYFEPRPGLPGNSRSPGTWPTSSTRRGSPRCRPATTERCAKSWPPFFP